MSIPGARLGHLRPEITRVHTDWPYQSRRLHGPPAQSGDHFRITRNAFPDSLEAILAGPSLPEHMARSALNGVKWLGAAKPGFAFCAAVMFGTAVVLSPLCAPLVGLAAGFAPASMPLTELVGRADGALALGTMAITSATGMPVMVSSLRLIVGEILLPLNLQMARLFGPGLNLTLDDINGALQTVMSIGGSLAFGVNMAPFVAVLVGAHAGPVAAIAAPLALIGLWLHQRASMLSSDGWPLPFVQGATAFGMGTAAMNWAIMGGIAAPAAVHFGLCAGASVAIMAVCLGLFQNSGQFCLNTDFADAHWVRSEPATKMTALLSKGLNQAAYGAPAALQAGIDRLMAKAWIDEDGIRSWAGQPVLNFITVPGAGATSHVQAMADTLGADLIRTTGAKLRALEAANYTTIGVTYLITMVLQAEERALREKKPQVVLVENVEALFAMPHHMSRGQRLDAYAKLATITGFFAQFNANRHRTVLVFTGADNGKGNTARAILSPRAAIRFEPLTQADRLAIGQNALAQLQARAKQHRWPVRDDFWTGAPITAFLGHLASRDISGRLIEDAVLACERALDLNLGQQAGTGEEAQVRVLRRFEQQIASIDALIADRLNPSGDTLPKSGTQDGSASMIQEMISNPMHLLQELAFSAKARTVADLSGQNTLRCGEIERRCTDISTVYVNKSTMGKANQERSDYNAMFDCAIIQSSGGFGPFGPDIQDTFEEDYVADVLMPAGSVFSKRVIFERLLRGESSTFLQVIEDTFNGGTHHHPFVAFSKVPKKGRFEPREHFNATFL